MKKLMGVALAVLPTLILAQGTFEGTWRMNLQDTQYVGTEKYGLTDGQFRCTTCEPKIDVKADGQDHPFTGSPYADTINVKAIGDSVVDVVNKKAGKVTGSMKVTASADGRTLNTEFSSLQANGKTVTGKYTSTRVGAAAPAGVHKINGEWQPGKLDTYSADAMEFTYARTGDTWKFSDQIGNSYSAKFDGKDYPFKGDPGVTTVSVRQIDARTIEETYKRDGKSIIVNRATLSADGKSIAMSTHDILRDVTTKITATRR
ncbi:MAG: hypothetical protein ABI875_08200 [Gemmatimonadales bacterium]